MFNKPTTTLYNYKLLFLGGVVFLAAMTFVIGKQWNTRHTISLTDQEKVWLKAHPVIRLAPDPDFPPTEFFDANGNHKGVAADYVSLLQKRLGIRFQIVKLRDWSEVLTKARQRKIDVLAAATKTPERSEYLLFTKPYLEFPAVLVAKNGFKGPLTLRNMTGRKMSVKAGYAARYYVITNFPGIQVDVVPDIHTGLRKVSAGTSDAFLENLLTVSYYLEKDLITDLHIAGEAEFMYRMAFAVRSDWPILQGILEKGLDQITPDEKQVIHNKWVPLNAQFLLINKRMTPPLFIGVGSLFFLVMLIFLWNLTLRKQVARRTGELSEELNERRRIEAALRESEEKFRVLADTSPAAIFLYRGEDIVYVNPSVTKLTGYSEQECFTMKFWEWIAADFQDQVKFFGLARQQGASVPEQYEAKFRAKDGKIRWMLVSAGSIQYRGENAGIASVFDITDRKRMEDELRRANEELEQRVNERTLELAANMETFRLTHFTVEKSSDQAFWTKKDGQIFYVNNSACRNLEYDRAELLGMSMRNIDPDFNFDDLDVFWDTLREKNSLTFESTHRTKYGRTYPVEVRANFVVFGDEEYNCCFTTDISERKQDQETLRKAHDELDLRVRERTEQLTNLTAELSRAEENERRRIATDLHDQVAQTLALSKIKLNSLLLTGQVGDGAEALTEIIDHLGTAIEEIRSLTFQLSPPILHEFGLAAALEWLSEEFQDKYGVRIRFRDDGKPKTLDDEIRAALYQMSRELLVNVIKHAQASNVLVEARSKSGLVSVCVSDDGVGFDPSNALRYGRLNNSIGLLNIHHRMDHLGGQLAIESGCNHGTKATLILPIKIPAQKSAGELP